MPYTCRCCDGLIDGQDGYGKYYTNDETHFICGNCLSVTFEDIAKRRNPRETKTRHSLTIDNSVT